MQICDNELVLSGAGIPDGFCLCFGALMKKPLTRRDRGPNGEGYASVQRARGELHKATQRNDGYSYKNRGFKKANGVGYEIVGTLINENPNEGATLPLNVNGKQVLFYFDTPPTDDYKEATRLSAEAVEDAMLSETQYYPRNK